MKGTQCRGLVEFQLGGATRAILGLLAVLLGACSGRPTAAASTTAGARVTPPLAMSTCEGASDFDVVHHAIDLALRFDPPALSGHGEVRLRARRDATVVVLDAYHMHITAVASRGAPVIYRQSEERVCARLPATVQAGTEVSLQLAWDVSPNRATLHVTADQMWAGYRASVWMPTLQDPAQRATLSLRITAPADIVVAASGRALHPEPAGGARITSPFLLSRPSPPFLYAFAAGRFDSAELDVDGLRLRALGPRGADLPSALAMTAPMARFLREHTGAPFPAAEYVEVFVDGDAAQEAAGLSLLAATSLDDVRKDPTEDWLFSHELAHQWFGWFVPCADFRDFWLNEGFATFLVAAIKEERWGRAAYDRELALWRARSAKVHMEARDAPVSLSAPGLARGPLSETELQTRGVTYARGALVLDKLRRELGDVAFWDAVRRYVRERAGQSARTEDLRAAMEAASGKDLRDFFARWVYAPAPDL
jgi:aminopeptidase N